MKKQTLLFGMISVLTGSIESLRAHFLGLFDPKKHLELNCDFVSDPEHGGPHISLYKDVESDIILTGENRMNIYLMSEKCIIKFGFSPGHWITIELNDYEDMNKPEFVGAVFMFFSKSDVNYTQKINREEFKNSILTSLNSVVLN